MYAYVYFWRLVASQKRRERQFYLPADHVDNFAISTDNNLAGGELKELECPKNYTRLILISFFYFNCLKNKRKRLMRGTNEQPAYQCFYDVHYSMDRIVRFYHSDDPLSGVRLVMYIY